MGSVTPAAATGGNSILSGFMRAMTLGVRLSASTFVFVGEAFSLDRRGWKAAPTGDIPTDLKAVWRILSGNLTGDRALV
jgi:hypothetical protein